MELYTDISDFPIFNWFKCIDLKDYTYCLVKQKECNDKQTNECMEAFGNMYAQYIDTFGISENLRDILELQNQILVHKVDMTLTNDRSHQMFISIKELDLAKLMVVKETKGNTAKVAIEKYLGFKINERTTSVKEYYEYLQAIKEDNGRETDTK
ncbi:MAG: hypothetical protein V4538_15600 [Bacteroidota bacterium]